MKYKKLDPNVPDLIRHTEGAAGFDLCSTVDIHPTFGILTVPTGIAVEIPKGYVGLLSIRSSMARYMHMMDGVGIIDSDYRGEIKLLVQKTESFPAKLDMYSRVAQLVIVPCVMESFIEAEELSETDRGINGFGSTGL